jgi:hypothetical protein
VVSIFPRRRILAVAALEVHPQGRGDAGAGLQARGVVAADPRAAVDDALHALGVHPPAGNGR